MACSGDDDPYAESHFRTAKRRPDFPKTFGSFEDTHAHGGRFFSWYNHEHRHSGIGPPIPAYVHYGRADAIREKGVAVLTTVYAAHLPKASCERLRSPSHCLRRHGSISPRGSPL